MLLTVYLDDVLLMGLSDLCAKVSQLLSAAYELITLVKYLLGVEILIDRQRLHFDSVDGQYRGGVIKLKPHFSKIKSGCEVQWQNQDRAQLPTCSAGSLYACTSTDPVP
ncbi:hypothetical protein C6341_g26074 [Phytophthora cactorum]|nr:hypothetical protein C6341_g26074 [Phytophthora cactorum]